VDFELVDVSGPKEPAVLRRLVVTVADTDRHVEDWTFELAGGQTVHARFDLKRERRPVRPRPRAEAGRHGMLAP
jgi:hypothetical protein